MKKSNLVSAIIPTYNRVVYLAKCIDSVLGQKNPGCPVEIIVIDDGSTDETQKLLKRYGSKILCVKIGHSGRPAIPRNVGIKQSRGNFIAFLDSDDSWTTDKLAMQLPPFNDPKIVLTFSNARIINKDGVGTGKTILMPGLDPGNVKFELLCRENIVSTLTVVARKDAILRCGGFDESPKLSVVEDYHLWLKLSLAGQFHYIDKVLADYRRHSDSNSAISQMESARALIKMFKRLKRELPEKHNVINTQLSKLYRDCSNLSELPFRQIYSLLGKHYASL